LTLTKINSLPILIAIFYMQYYFLIQVKLKYVKIYYTLVWKHITLICDTTDFKYGFIMKK
jgi:hypothetical protein